MYGLNAGYLGAPRFQEYDLAELDGCGVDGDGVSLENWDDTMLSGFGAYIPQYGIMDGPQIYVETDTYDDLGDGTVRTPMLEFTPFDFDYLQQVNYPYPGMLALSDVGDLYEYDQLSGLFSRIKRGFKKLGKKIKKGVRKVAKKVKKVLSKTKFGRAIIKVAGKIHKVAMKLVKPLSKVVGKFAKKLAPIAAMIPGYGPAISGALMAAGKAANIVKKYGGKLKKVINVDQKTGKRSTGYKLDVKNPKKLRGIQQELKREAEKMKKRPKRDVERLAKKLRNVDPEKTGAQRKGKGRLKKSSIAAAARMTALARKEQVRDNRMVIARAMRNNPERVAQISEHIAALKKLGIRVPMN
jgi:hypothetical protein